MSGVRWELEGAPDGHSAGSGEEGSSEGKAPSDFLAECLSASLRRRYGAALRYCRLILRHEPQHRAARALLPTLRTRAAAAAAVVTGTTLQEIVGNVGDNSASATDSSYSMEGADQSHSGPSRSESRLLDRSHSESRSEDNVSELDLESELEDELLEDLDTYTSTGASSSHEVSDSSGGGGDDAVCDDNGNCTTTSDIRNDNASPGGGTAALHPLPHSHENWQHDMCAITLDNDPRLLQDYHLRKSCAH